MIVRERYLALRGIKERRYYVLLRQGSIFSHTDPDTGAVYVIDPEMDIPEGAVDSTRDAITGEFKKMCLYANTHPAKTKDTVDKIQRIVKTWNKKGLALRGWSKTKCYEKIKDTKLLDRKQRWDKNIRVYNSVLQSADNQDKLAVLFSKFYQVDYSKRPSIRQLIHRVKMFAENNRVFSDLKSVPYSTMHNHLTALIKQHGMDKKHLLKNAYSEFAQDRVYVDGAFTSEIQFMDWYQMDDHNMEVSGALVWDEGKGKYVNRKVYLWMISEVKTMYPIAYMIQARPFRQEDIKILMMKALMQMGRPRKGILMDNGLAASKECREFLDRLRIVHDPGEAYDPRHKALKEREFGWIKDEFCTQFPNYIGGGKYEVRHTGKKLSPEETTYTIDSFIEKFDIYMEGFYQARPRQLTDNFEVNETSCRDKFNSYYMKYEKNLISTVDLNKAYMLRKVVKLQNQFVEFGKYGLYAPHPDKMFHPTLCKRKYMAYFNPVDLNEIDLYELEGFLIRNTGEQIPRGKHIGSVRALRNLGTAEQQRQVKEINARYIKAVRNLEDAATDLSIVNNVDAFSPEVNPTGQIIDTRIEQKARVSEIINDAASRAANIIPEELPKKRRVEIPEEYKLSKEEMQGLNDIAEGYDE